LLLQFVDAVLAVGAIAVKLRHRFDGVHHVGDHHRVLPPPFTRVHAGAGQVQFELAAVGAALARDAALDALVPAHVHLPAHGVHHRQRIAADGALGERHFLLAF